MNSSAKTLLHPIEFKGARRHWLLASLILFGVLFSAIFAYKTIYRAEIEPQIYKARAGRYAQAQVPQVKKIDGEKVEILPAGPVAYLPEAKWVPQTFNNCAPATTSMVLQYFGYNVSQETTKTHLRTNPDDKNVFTYEIRDYLKSNYNIESKLLYNGDIKTIKLLVANGIYVVVEDWLHPNEDIGHVAIIRGYDDTKGVFIADDSYIGVNTKYKYGEFDQGQWKAFNREYLPVYNADQEPLVRAIVAEDWDETAMYGRSIEVNLNAVEADEKDMYSWFNLGTSYYALGEFDKARQAFEKSRALGWPKRMLWYQIQPVQTYNKLGEYQKALELAKIGLVGNDSFAELHLESAIAYKGLGDKERAREVAEKALHYSPNFQAAKDLLYNL